MAVGINFKKSKAEYLLDCIRNGKPIQPIDLSKGWTQDDMLAVAGAMLFAVKTHGPALLPPEEKAKLPEEYQEAYEHTFYSEIVSAIEWYGKATMMVNLGQYDEEFEDHHRAILVQKETKRLVVPMKGFRNGNQGRTY
jgi:hypothetical protein